MLIRRIQCVNIYFSHPAGLDNCHYGSLAVMIQKIENMSPCQRLLPPHPAFPFFFSIATPPSRQWRLILKTFDLADNQSLWTLFWTSSFSCSPCLLLLLLAVPNYFLPSLSVNITLLLHINLCDTQTDRHWYIQISSSMNRQRSDLAPKECLVRSAHWIQCVIISSFRFSIKLEMFPLPVQPSNLFIRSFTTQIHSRVVKRDASQKTGCSTSSWFSSKTATAICLLQLHIFVQRYFEQQLTKSAVLSGLFFVCQLAS